MPCCNCEQYRNFNICYCSFCLEKDFYKRPDEYECEKKMLFYVLNYGPVYISDIYHYLKTSHILESFSHDINVLSLGCGFCPDYYALTKYIQDYNLDISFSFTGLDKAGTWDKTRKQYQNIQYIQADLTDPNYSLSFQNYDIISVNKMFSTLYRHGTHKLFLHKIHDAITKSMSKGTVLIFNDVNDTNYSGRDEFDTAVSDRFDAVRKYYTDGYHNWYESWIKISETGIIYDKISEYRNISPLLSTKSVFFEYRK
jgi:hypothetical protein